MTSHESIELFEVPAIPQGRRSSSNLLFQPRPEGNPDYTPYRGAANAPVAFVHRRVQQHIRTNSLSTVPNEVIGMLLGRPCRDGQGTYVLVEAAYTAVPGEYVGTPGAVRISGEGRASLKRRATERWPGLEDIGWYHSHPRGGPRFSPVDLDEQATYLAHQVGIVAAVEAYDAPGRGDPLGVYVGPSAMRLDAAVSDTGPIRGTEGTRPTGEASPHLAAEFRKRGAVAVAAVALVFAGWALSAILPGDRGPVRANSLTAHQPTPSRATATPVTFRRVAIVAPVRCAAGEQLKLAIAIPARMAANAVASTTNLAVAAPQLTRDRRAMVVTCGTPGRVVLTIRQGVAGGASTSFAVKVATAKH